jgi:hypothetical protein
MISMKTFITEVLDKPYDFKSGGSRANNHKYSFSSPHDDYKVSVYNDHNGPGHAEVEFTSKKGHLGKSKAEGISAHKVFSTVHHVIKHHLDQHKDQDSIQFSSTNKHPDEGDSQGSRTKLYRHLAKRFSNKHREFDPYGDNSETAFHIKRQDIK